MGEGVHRGTARPFMLRQAQHERWKGVGPTVVFVNQGVAKNLSTTSLQDDAYAVIFDQQGLMASLTIEGTKVSRISCPK